MELEVGLIHPYFENTDLKFIDKEKIKFSFFIGSRCLKEKNLLSKTKRVFFIQKTVFFFKEDNGGRFGGVGFRTLENHFGHWKTIGYESSASTDHEKHT